MNKFLKFLKSIDSSYKLCYFSGSAGLVCREPNIKLVSNVVDSACSAECLT